MTTTSDTNDKGEKKSTKIDAPTGVPFAVVGTKEAKAAVVVLSTWAREHPDVEDKHVYVIEDAEDMLRGLLAHRDHLHAQMTDVQACNTGYVAAARESLSRLTGVCARMDGVQRVECPIVENDPMRVAWEEGWDTADKFSERVVATVREVDKYAPRPKPEPMPPPGNGRSEGP